MTHLKDAGQLEVVEDGKEEICSEGDHDDVSDPYHPVLSPEHVHLGRSPEHGNGRHEGS